MTSSSFLSRVLGTGAFFLLSVLSEKTDANKAPHPQLKIDDFRGKNVIILIIDQMRQIQDFPPGWSEANLPGLTRLQQNGLTFSQATCNAAMCSPSRATLFTGRFPAQHGVRWVLEEGMPETRYPQRNMPLPDQLDNMATMAIEAGYEAVFKGKFHCVKKSTGSNGTWIGSDMAQYGFGRWNFPDAGANQQLSECADCNSTTGHNDFRYINDVGNMVDGKEGAIAFIEYAADQAQAQGKPFFMVLSLINPHDVLFQPQQFAASGYNETFLDGDIGLPMSINESLLTKPTSQSQYRNIGITAGITPSGYEEQLGYINFYGNLQKLVDSYVVQTLDKLTETGLLEDTLIVNMADHGEMGLSHGGQIQKDFNFYEETLRIPLTFSNPKLFPTPLESEQLVSLVDLLPTLATLLDAPKSAYPTRKKKWSGVDFSSVVLNPRKAKKVQDYTIFTFDDYTSGQPTVLANGTIGAWPQEPAHLISIREKRWKIAMYYDPAEAVTKTPRQWELYDRLTDPEELNNLAYINATRTKAQERQYRRLQKKLKRVIHERLGPVPLERSIEMIIATNSTVIPSKKNTLSQEGPASGVPIGQGTLFTNVRLRRCEGSDIRTCDSANIKFTVSSRSGVIYGRCMRCKYSYDVEAGQYTLEGKAELQDGTWGFRDIKSKSVTFTQTGPLSGVNAVTTIVGSAWY